MLTGDRRSTRQNWQFEIKIVIWEQQRFPRVSLCRCSEVKIDGLRRRSVDWYAFVGKMHVWTRDHILVSSLPWPLTFWPQNLISPSLSQTAPKLHSWWNPLKTIGKISCLQTFGIYDHRRTHTHTHGRRKKNRMLLATNRQRRHN